MITTAQEPKTTNQNTSYFTGNANSEMVNSEKKAEQSSLPYHGRGFDMSEISVLSSSTNLIQPKLTVNQPNDKYEQEADRVADQVMRMPETSITNSAPEIQRKCKECEEERSPKKAISSQIVQRKGFMKEEIMPKREGGEHKDYDISSDLHSAGSGSSLSNQTKTFFESRFGTDFSDVRIHTDTQAAHMSSKIGARAFTHQGDIYFNNGEYNPGTQSGKHLLGHELTHVVQQKGLASTPAIQRSCCSDSKTAGQDNGDIAGVICCNKVKHACVWVSGGATGATNAKAISIIDACGEAHEKDHFDDIDCPNGAGPHRPNFKSGKVASDEEKNAYKAEEICLNSKKSQCGSDNTCKAQVKAELTHVKSLT